MRMPLNPHPRLLGRLPRPTAFPTLELLLLTLLAVQAALLVDRSGRHVPFRVRLDP